MNQTTSLDQDREKKKPTSPARTLEGLRLLNDWNKWLVGVQTAAIASLGFLARNVDVAVLKTTEGTLAIATGTGSLVLFCFSIAFASYLLLFIPSVIEELPEQYDNDNPAIPLSYMRVPFNPGWQVGTFTMWQSRLFVLGIALFGLTFVLLPHANNAAAVPPNPSLKAATRYGSHRLAAPGCSEYHPSAASRRLPPRSPYLER